MKTHRGRRRLLGLLVVVLACAGGGLAVPHPARAATKTVDEVGNSFQPKRADITVNDRIVWRNQSNRTHTVTFDKGPDLHPACERDALLRVGCQGPGATAEYTFTALGTYPYYCKIHGGPDGQGMAGVVVVAAASTPSTTVPATTSSTTARATTTTTVKATSSTSSTTTTTRALATSSTVASSSTTSTTPDTSTVLLPGDPPPFSGDDINSSAAGRSGGSKNRSDTTTVVLIVALLLAVSAGGGYLLWRLRPGRV